MQPIQSSSSSEPADFAVPIPEDIFEPNQLRDLHSADRSQPTALPAAEPESESLNSQPSPLNSTAHGAPPSVPQPSTKNSQPQSEFTPPRFGAHSLRRYRLRWTTFKRFCKRPTPMEPELLNEMYDMIEHYGVSDDRAALLHKVSTSTIAQWKEKDPDLVQFFEIARSEFELDQTHAIQVFKRKDGQTDPQNAKWLLERTNPEKWGRPSARKTAAAAPNPKFLKPPLACPETASNDAPKPGTPEYWDYVEEEPFPRNLSTCIITPGRQKFFSILHLTKVPYLPGPDDPDPKRGQPSNNPTPEQREATREAFFRLQDHYFSLPKDQRIPFLHQVYQQQFGKILPEHQAAAALSRSGGALAPHQNDTNHDSFATPQQSKSQQNIPEIHAAGAPCAPAQPEIAEAASGVPHAATSRSGGVPSEPAVEVLVVGRGELGETAPHQNDANPAHFASPQQSKTTQNIPEIQAGAAASSAPAATPLETASRSAPVIREKLPSEYTHEENIAYFHVLARREAERREREAAALFNYDDDEDPGWDDDFD